MWLKCSLCSKKCFVTLLSAIFFELPVTQTPDNSNLFSISLEGSNYRELTVFPRMKSNKSVNMREELVQRQAGTHASSSSGALLLITEEKWRRFKQTWRQRLLEFVSFLFVLNDQSVKITTASHLELNSIFYLLYFHSYVQKKLS